MNLLNEKIYLASKAKVPPYGLAGNIIRSFARRNNDISGILTPAESNVTAAFAGVFYKYFYIFFL